MLARQRSTQHLGLSCLTGAEGAAQLPNLQPKVRELQHAATCCNLASQLSTLCLCQGASPSVALGFLFCLVAVCYTR